MSLANIRSAIKDALSTIPGLAVSDYIPDTYSVPIAVITLKPDNPVDYDYTSGNNNYVYHFQIDVLVNKGASVYQAQVELDPYIDPSSDKSIKNAIEAIDFGTDANVKRLIGAPTYGEAKAGGTNYLGVRFNLDITV
jgi:hypothetical protein